MNVAAEGVVLLPHEKLLPVGTVLPPISFLNP